MSAQTAQEASMEDILASIRKIISEDSKDDPANEMPGDIQDETQALAADYPADETNATLPPVLTERREFLEDNYSTTRTIQPETENLPADNNSAQVMPPPISATSPVRNVAIPGFMEKVPHRDEGEQQNPDIAIKKETQVPLHPAIATASDYTGAPTTAPVLEPDKNLAVEKQEKPVFTDTTVAPSAEYARDPLISPDSVERRDDDERRNHPLRRGADRETDEFRNALMSPRTDNAVADAFEQLKNSATDNLDGKVEALLRPMLREWLDNNLPSMVERLVRDEIERVSRGD